MSLKWSKTKIVFLTKKSINFCSNYSLFLDGLLCDWVSSKEAEEVTEFKLLGIVLDKSLSFNAYLKQFKCNVC